MTALILSKPLRKLLVIGPIYNKLDKLSKIDELLSQYDYVIFNGGLCYSLENLKKRLQAFDNWAVNKKIIYIVGRNELQLLNKIDDQEILTWIHSHCNIVIANFDSRTVIVTDGGLPQNLKGMYELMDNLEVSFISQVGDKPWHVNYNGGLGYVISNNPLNDSPPQYYNYSMRLGCLYDPNAPVYAQEVDEIGLKNSILL